MTANQLHQALRTYTSHWTSWVTVLFWLLIHAQLPSAREQGLADIMWMSLMANIALGTGIGLMLKIQFANPRARLLPGFRVPHLVVNGAIVCAALAIEAVLTPAWADGATRLALLSLTLLAMVAGAWLAYSNISALWLLVAPVVLAPIFVPQLVAGSVQALTSSPLASLGMTAVGLAGLVALGMRLWGLSEENPEYSRQIPGVWDFTSQAGNRSRRRLEAQAIARSTSLMWRLDLQFRLVVRPTRAPMGLLRRLLFRQLAGGFASLFMTPSIFAIMLLLLWFQSGSERPLEPGEFFPLAFFLMQIVLGMEAGMWLQRWRYLAPESLWPLKRRDLVRDLALSLACDMAPAAAAHCVAIVTGVIFFFPQNPLAGLLLPWLALTAVQYVVAYCAMFWLVASRSVWLLILGAFGVSVLSAAFATAALFAGAGFWTPVTLAVAIVVTASVAVLLYQLAFRRWCYVDLG